MGGQNHQPCGRYLKNSTRMSRELSAGRLALEAANISLEDALLEELDGKHGRIDPIQKHLEEAVEAEAAFARHVDALRGQMREEGYVELPSFTALDLWARGEAVSEGGMVDGEAWRLVHEQMRRGGFWTVLDGFDERMREIMRLTEKLSTEVAALRESADAGVLVEVLEENRPGNIKRTFAKLYHAWNDLNAVFLASSMLSTELWYTFTGVGTLAPDMPVRKAG